jgi:hypothetical protein
MFQMMAGFGGQACIHLMIALVLAAILYMYLMMTLMLRPGRACA